MAGPLLRLCAVDDDPTQLTVLSLFVRELEGTELSTFQDPDAALQHLAENPVDVLLVDLHMPKLSGREVLRRSMAISPELPVVIMTSTAAVETAVELMRLGARDYLTKPLNRPLFVQRVLRLGEQRHLQRELTRLQSPVFVEELVGHSPALQSIKRKIQQLAEERAPVWVCGPSGSKLSRIARALHQSSSRRDHPFITLDALPRSSPDREALLFGRRLGAFAHESRRLPGVIERAAGGTLVVGLGKGLEESTYRALSKLGPDGPRLVVTVEGFSAPPRWAPSDQARIGLPPLVERRSDIGILAHHIVGRLNRRFLKRCFLTATGLAALQARPWPGDVEELTEVLEGAVLASEGAISPSLLAHGPSSGPTLRARAPNAFKAEKERALRAFEEDYLNRLLLHAEGHLTRAAAQAGMDRKNLWQLLRKHGIDASDFRPSSSTTADSRARNRQDGEHG